MTLSSCCKTYVDLEMNGQFRANVSAPAGWLTGLRPNEQRLLVRHPGNTGKIGGRLFPPALAKVALRPSPAPGLEG
jgi:hypothetical protein